MASTLVGVIHGADTNKLYAIYSPHDDADLENPNLLTMGTENGEKVQVRALTRAEFDSYKTHDDLIEALKSGNNKPGKRIL